MFNYEKRCNPKIRVPSLIEGIIDDVQIGDNIVFEEIEGSKVKSCRGLKQFIQLDPETSSGGPQIYIMDNHNHALFFWYKHLFAGDIERRVKLIHIDQHTDMNECDGRLQVENGKLEDVFSFVNYECNVGNFIKPAVEEGLIKTVIQINTEYALRHCEEWNDCLPRKDCGEAILKNERDCHTSTSFCSQGLEGYILDIDLDFWAPEMSIQEYQKTVDITKKLLKKAKVVTIATSPYFLDQESAIKILKDLFL